MQKIGKERKEHKTSFRGEKRNLISAPGDTKRIKIYCFGKTTHKHLLT